MPATIPKPTRGLLTFEAEGQEAPGSRYHSRKLHVPSSSSGLTIGRGYDMKRRSAAEIRRHMEKAGLDAAQASLLAEAAGLSGSAAKAFITDRELQGFEIDPNAQLTLFEVVYDEIARDTRRLATKDDVTEAYGETDWNALDPTIRDVLVDLRFRGDYTPDCRRFLQTHVARNDLPAFAAELAEHTRWPEVPRDRFERRTAFCQAATESPTSDPGITSNASGAQNGGMVRAMSDIEQRLIDAAWPYWEAEAEIAKRFYAKATDEDHIFYLRAQLWKELNPVDGFFNGLHKELVDAVALYPKVDKEIDRHDYHFLLLQLVQEFNHYVVLADIFEHLMGRPISPEDTVQLDEEKKLGDVRRAYVEQDDPLLNAAVGFTEGGGARLFREGKELSGSVVNDMTAKAMQTIFDDEHDHYMEQAREAVSHIKSDADLKRMTDAIAAISEQRVWMRAEMFRDAMTRNEIEQFIMENRRA